MALIWADDERTWPSGVLDVLHPFSEELKGYEAFEADLTDRYIAGEVRARYNPPPNKFRPTRLKVLATLEALLREHSFVGWHCTRLLDEEVESILKDGLRTLDAELPTRKVELARRLGHLSPDEATRLLRDARIHEDDERRLGMIWCVFHRGILVDSGGLYELLGRWGGEAIYAPHRRKALARRLSQIGRPRIVEVVVPISTLWTFGGASERMVANFLDGKVTRQEGVAKFEGHSNAASIEVTRVLSEGDEEFEALTGYSTWDEVD